MFSDNIFTYKEPKIISAVPVSEINEYLRELGCDEKPGSKFRYNGLEIEITPCDDHSYPDLGIPRHMITVNGDKADAENFLSAFRFKFLSAGG